MKIEQIKTSTGANVDKLQSPLTGESRDVVKATKQLSSIKTESRVPIVSVTGTNGKTTVTRMIKHVFSGAGNRTGTMTNDRIRTVVETSILEIANSKIALHDFDCDQFDVAVITNIQIENTEQNGIESIEDFLKIKSLVADRVRRGGTLVLNADDALLVRWTADERASCVGKQIVYFSLKPNHVLLKRHVSAGGTAYTVKNGWIVELAPEGEFYLGRIAEIPATLNGQADFNVANALAAIAVCRAQNISHHQVMTALGEFRSESNNIGRFNLFHVNDGYVLLDYARNPEAIKAVCRTAAKWCDDERRITGIVAVAGDRDNEFIEAVGREAARGFHRVVVRENADLRGRESSEVAEILARAVRDKMPNIDCRIILDESEALKRQISVMREGDVVVCFYENFDRVKEILMKWDAQPAVKIEKTIARFSLARA